MIETLSVGEVEAMLNYVPDREPTRAELDELEKEVPSKLRQRLCLLKEEATERQPSRKIIINEEINYRYNYKRVIFNDGETIIDLDQTTPTRVKKKDTIIKIKSELAELYQDIRYIRKQQNKNKIWIISNREIALHKIKLRTIASETNKHINKLDKLLDIIYKV